MPTTTTTHLRGDEAQLYTDLHRRLFANVRAAVYGPDALIEDACQFAWTQLLRCQPDRGTAHAWLRTVAIRHAWQLSYRDRREPALPDRDIGRVDDHIADAHIAREALATLAALPAQQRDYLTLHTAGFTYDEIAKLRGITRHVVNKHLVRARATIRERRR